LDLRGGQVWFLSGSYDVGFRRAGGLIGDRLAGSGYYVTRRTRDFFGGLWSDRGFLGREGGRGGFSALYHHGVQLGGIPGVVLVKGSGGGVRQVCMHTLSHLVVDRRCGWRHLPLVISNN